MFFQQLELPSYQRLPLPSYLLPSDASDGCLTSLALPGSFPRGQETQDTQYLPV